MVQVQIVSAVALAQISHFCWLKTTSMRGLRLPATRQEYRKTSRHDGKESSSDTTGRAQKPHSGHLSGAGAQFLLNPRFHCMLSKIWITGSKKTWPQTCFSPIFGPQGRKYRTDQSSARLNAFREEPSVPLPQVPVKSMALKQFLAVTLLC